MIIEIGHFALILALGVALVQMALPAWGARAGDAPLMAVAEPAALAQLSLIALSFLALTHAYVTSDFSVETVWANSHSAKPLIYKISGVWGNHEGSMLLWVLILALFGAAVALFGGNLPATLRANVLAVQAGIAVAFLLFILLASNPFARIPPQPEGRGLNPVLQDPALAFHPPFLYAGYVGLSVAFSFAIAALIEGRTDAAWARWVRPWTLAAWICLTLGIAMGSWWAYYELGWGGWWFWDPVENASFMPWLAATALLHSALVMEKREALKVWTILLAILAFSLSLMGTFLVRSGILTSVHAFAVDPRRGVFILAILVVLIGGALALYAWRAPRLKQGGLFAPISREGALVLNNVLLTTGCATVFIGTLYPLALESLTGAKISVGPPYFNLTFVPVMVPLLLAMPLGPYLAWKRGDLAGAMQRLLAAGLAAVLCLVAAFALYLARAVAGAFRHCAGRLDHRRRCLRVGHAGETVRRRPRRSLAARPRSTALGLWRHAGACGHRPDGARHRRHVGLAERARRRHEAGRQHRDRRLPARLPRRRTGPGPQLSRAGRRAGGDARRGRRHGAQPRQAALRRATPGDHRGRHPCCLARRSLRGAGRRAEGRQRLGRAPLFQSAGAPHLARRHRHGARRRPLPLRPPPAHRRPPPRTPRRTCARGVMGDDAHHPVPHAPPPPRRGGGRRAMELSVRSLALALRLRHMRS